MCMEKSNFYKCVDFSRPQASPATSLGDGGTGCSGGNLPPVSLIAPKTHGRPEGVVPTKKLSSLPFLIIFRLGRIQINLFRFLLRPFHKIYLVRKSLNLLFFQGKRFFGRLI